MLRLVHLLMDTYLFGKWRVASWSNNSLQVMTSVFVAVPGDAMARVVSK